MRSLFIALAAVFSMGAFANDGGVAYINVKGIDPTRTTDEYGVTQVAEFYGKDITKFMQILPPSFSVISSDFPQFGDNYKSLALVSNGNILMINCEAGEMQFPGDGTFTFVPYAQGPKCRITLQRRQYDLGDYLGDPVPFEKETMVCGQP